MGWPDRRLPDLFGIDLPIIQAPMANFSTTAMAIAAAGAGALGSIPCASLSPEQIRAATHLADANVVFLRWGRGGREGCEGSDPQGVLLLPLRSAAKELPAGESPPERR